MEFISNKTKFIIYRNLIFINKIYSNLKILLNNDMYKVLAKESINLNSNLKSTKKLFFDSFNFWVDKRKTLNKSQRFIHDIAYNHYIRSYTLFLYNKNKPTKNFNSPRIYILLFINISLFLIKFLKKFIINSQYIYADEILENRKNICTQTLITHLNKKLLKRLESMNIKFIENKKILNILIDNKNYKKVINRKIYNKRISKMKSIKISLILLKYLINNPWLFNRIDKLFNSSLLFVLIKEDNNLNKFDGFNIEVYNFLSRAVVQAVSQNGYNNYLCFYLKKDKSLEKIYYDCDLIFQNKKELKVLKYINVDFQNQKNKKIKEIKKKYSLSNKNNNRIIIQASDSWDTGPTTYELNAYKEIYTYYQNYNGEIIFVFHPANSKIAVFLKKIAIRFLFHKKKNIKLIFKHKEEIIEEIVLNNNLDSLLTIDLSSAIQNVLDLNRRVKYLNLNNERHNFKNPYKTNFIEVNSLFK